VQTGKTGDEVVKSTLFIAVGFSQRTKEDIKGL
jgi:hypothetical protein